MEVESLNAADQQQKANGSTTRPKINSNNILRPEKHVSFKSRSLSLIHYLFFVIFRDWELQSHAWNQEWTLSGRQGWLR